MQIDRYFRVNSKFLVRYNHNSPQKQEPPAGFAPALLDMTARSKRDLNAPYSLSHLRLCGSAVLVLLVTVLIIQPFLFR